MTDAELLEWLRKPYGDAMMERAADRIEALIAERNDWESHAIYNAEFVDLAVSYRNERDAARAKLAKAVEAVDKAAALIEERHVVHMTAKGRNPKDYISEWSLIAKEVRAMLAELKGESHE